MLSFCYVIDIIINETFYILFFTPSLGTHSVFYRSTCGQCKSTFTKSWGHLPLKKA